jgi:hypothetical protein
MKYCAQYEIIRFAHYEIFDKSKMKYFVKRNIKAKPRGPKSAGFALLLKVFSEKAYSYVQLGTVPN